MVFRYLVLPPAGDFSRGRKVTKSPLRTYGSKDSLVLTCTVSPPWLFWPSCLRRSVDVSGTDYYRASARSIGGLTMVAVSKSLPLGEGGPVRTLGRMRGAVSEFSRSIRRQLPAKNWLLIFSELAWSFWVAFPSSASFGGTFPQGKAKRSRGSYNHQGSAPKRGNRGTVTPLQGQPHKVTNSRNKTFHNRK